MRAFFIFGLHAYLNDRAHIQTGRNDLAYVTAEVVDVKKKLVSNAAQLLHFFSSNGEIMATGNADPRYHKQDRQRQELYICTNEKRVCKSFRFSLVLTFSF